MIPLYPGRFACLTPCVLLALGLLSAPAPVALAAPPGRPVAASPLQMTLTLDDSEILPGQPIVVTVKIANRSSSRLSWGETESGDVPGDWLHLEWRDDTGKVVSQAWPPPRIPLTYFQHPDGIEQIIEDGEDSTIRTLPSDKEVSWRFVLPAGAAPDQPGRYTLNTSATLTLLPQSPEGKAVERLTLPEATAPITIAPADREKLRQIARRLCRNAFGPDTYSRIDLDGLFVMPPAAVRSVWRSFALNPARTTNQRSTVATYLSKQGSLDAAWILGEMWTREHNAGGSPEQAERLRQTLRSLRARSGNEELRKYLDKLLGPESATAGAGRG